ncbi:hypothetical protein BDR07DRAFT_1401865, partial [Suillus spraguei]
MIYKFFLLRSYLSFSEPMSSTNHYAPAHSSQLAAESPSAFQYGSAQPQATDPIGLEEEMPPAGPRRPFQQQPRPSHSTHRPSHSYSSSHSHSSHTTSSSSNSQPLSLSQQHPQQPLRTVPSTWTMHTTGQQYQPRRGGGLVGTLVGTVRDAIDAVSSLHDEQMRTMQQSQARAYASPHPTSSSSRITQNTSTPFWGAFCQQIPDDGSPTRTPAPGHPLLNNGHLLVYPNKDYICIKCKNTGYKNYDPSHPCRKCWEKYGKPYAGPLMYTSWNTESSSRNSKFQRALPKFTPPQVSQSSSYTISPQASTPYGQHLYVFNPAIGMGQTAPVPHAIPCTQCGGTGTLPLFIIDIRPAP